MNRTAIVIAIIGALVWGVVGIFAWNPLTWMFGGLNWVTRIVYTIVGLSGIWCIGLLFRERKSAVRHD